ncbi:MAG: 2-oxoacid:acceptor oxidoreductase family protein [Candidatus Azobacteroides pseudotrichonymphae]|jgi:2-oxoglutarate ferredoxin oxidoreductase subunit gamma|nr:MAG: 2-oxoacid:acceptor oxidoreductase family protein [Candidatus Azobacteroides pseudotrichonymphae]
MQHEIIIAGFGGQGILSMGKILAYAGLLEGKEVTWFPSYGPEQRGGTANVTVILSDERISSPVLNEYNIAIILNQLSLEKFEQTLKAGGVLLYDKYRITQLPTRKNIRIFETDATNTSIKEGSTKVFNMIVLGGIIKITQIVKIESIIDSLKKSLPERNHKFLPMNQRAFFKGMDLIKEMK